MSLSKETKLVAGIMILTVPTIEFGGTFLLRVLVNDLPELELNELQRAMFRAGHAHAGVLVILGLLAQLFLDHVRLPRFMLWPVRLAFVAGPLLVSGGFFGGAAEAGLTRPTALIGLLWAGVYVEGAALLALGAGLLRAARAPA